MLVTIENLNKSFGDETILDNIKLTINEKGRYGLVGANGTGKSTLLKIIMGDMPYDSGQLVKKPSLSLGYLAQNDSLSSDSTIIKEMERVFADVFAAEENMRELESEMSSISDHTSDEYRIISARYSSLMSYFDSRDGYNIPIKIKTILNGMGFGDKDMDTPISTLSGGEKTRLAMARLLLKEPELLILDEPTNHLDFKTLKWLEDYLASYNGAIFTVSHDRYFLDKTVNHIYEITNKRLYSFSGNYTAYLPQKEQLRAQLEKEYLAQRAEIARMQEYIDKNIARASTSQSAKSRQKALDAMDIVEKPGFYEQTMKLRFEHTKDPYKDVLSVSNLDIAVGDPPCVICKGINLQVKRGEKIAIIGKNGIGKSSFLKIIQGIIPKYTGSFEWGKNVSISYYEQENLNLSHDKIALDELWDRFPHIPETEIRNALGRVLLSQEDVFKPVRVISGGERAKLAFCIIMLEKSNVLILDEPTNHLDLASKEILEKALSDFGGTIIFVSHDRYLLSKGPHRIVEITPDGTDIFDGNYEYMCEVLERRSKDFMSAEKETAEEKSEKPRNGSFRSKEQRRLDVKKKNRIKELEDLIADAESRLSSLEGEMSDPEILSDYKLMAQKCSEVEALRNAVDQYFDEWTMLCEN